MGVFLRPRLRIRFAAGAGAARRRGSGPRGSAATAPALYRDQRGQRHLHCIRVAAPSAAVLAALLPQHRHQAAVSTALRNTGTQARRRRRARRVEGGAGSAGRGCGPGREVAATGQRDPLCGGRWPASIRVAAPSESAGCSPRGRERRKPTAQRLGWATTRTGPRAGCPGQTPSAGAGRLSWAGGSTAWTGPGRRAGGLPSRGCDEAERRR